LLQFFGILVLAGSRDRGESEADSFELQ
jgi:hypothetical protein